MNKVDSYLLCNGEMRHIAIGKDLAESINSDITPLLLKKECMGVIGKVIREKSNITFMIGDDYIDIFNDFDNYILSKIHSYSDDDIVFVLS